MSSQEIYQGFWQNHSVAGIWGWTLTLSNARANNLVVFLGIYLAFVGSAFWSIIAFLIHQLMSSKYPGDGIHHQICLILRNTSSPLRAAREFVAMAFNWRTVETRQRIMNPLLLSIVPLLIGIGFIAAGIESSRVSAGESSINDVKIKAQNCGLSLWDDSNSTTGSIPLAFWLARTAKDANAYVEDCYGDFAIQQLPNVCTYAVDQIRYAVSSNQTCPFDGTVCLGGPENALTMDTGLLDSHLALGINAPLSNRVFIGKSVTCSVLNHTAYSNYTTITNPDGSNMTVHRLYFGPYDDDYTYSHTDSSVVDGFGYELVSITFSPDEQNDWDPIAPLHLIDAEVTIFILSANGVSYVSAVDDVMFAAHNSFITPGLYRADDDYQVLGCAEKYQVCPTSKETASCTAVNSRSHIYQQIHNIGLNQAQLTTAELVLNLSETANIFTSVFGISSTALLARDRVFQDLLSEGLPNNQWQLEARNFFDISLARLQEAVMDFASKSYPFVTGQNLIPPSPEMEKYICQNQKIRDVGGYESFTAAAVLLIIIVGLIILILRETMDHCFAMVQRRFKWKSYKMMQWTTDGKFQQQRIAMSESGYGRWTGSWDDIPVTRRGDVLAVPKQNSDGLLIY